MAGGVYWVGKDGNVYAKSSAFQGVKNVGSYSQQKALKDQGLPTFISNYSQIDDPVASQQPSNNNSVSRPTGGGSGGSVPALNTAAISNTQKAVDSLDNERSVGMRSIADSFDSLMGKYGKEAARAEADYGEQTVTNNQNLAKNKQNALVAGAQGRRGLRGVLSSFGALSGDGAKLADRAVMEAANDDIGEATETAATNSQGLDKAINNFREDDKDRRAEAQTARSNQETALEGNILKKRQDFFNKMAELYNEGGNVGEATRYLNMAGDLNNPIVSKTAVASTPFTERAAAFTPGDLESYLAGAGDMTVEVSNGGANGINSPTTLLAGRKKRERETATV